MKTAQLLKTKPFPSVNSVSFSFYRRNLSKIPDGIYAAFPYILNMGKICPEEDKTNSPLFSFGRMPVNLAFS
jgi:hypothetical protein